ncbi:MAG: hypothetical protein R3B45_07195 [Bdellovibrionota bacterium]
MNINRFIHSSGFKVLALAKLSQCEYSIALYLMNCCISGINQIITTEGELRNLLGYSDDFIIRNSLATLRDRKIIHLNYSDTDSNETQHPSMRIGMQLDTSRWLLDNKIESGDTDAIVYPFRRAGEAPFRLLPGDSLPKQRPGQAHTNETWARIQQEFARGRTLDKRDMEEAEKFAKILVDTHPVDQVLIYLKHFGLRIPSLSLLASSWQHYQELFEAETQKIDIMEARQKHLSLDEELRKSARETLEKAEDLELSEEDRSVLNILANHRHPRRQLFWAFQLRSRYQKLKDFFEKNASKMIPITSAGLIVRKTPPKIRD